MADHYAECAASSAAVPPDVAEPHYRLREDATKLLLAMAAPS